MTNWSKGETAKSMVRNMKMQKLLLRWALPNVSEYCESDEKIPFSNTIGTNKMYLLEKEVERKFRLTNNRKM